MAFKPGSKKAPPFGKGGNPFGKKSMADVVADHTRKGSFKKGKKR